MHLNTLLVQADSLRFKLLGFIGRDEGKKTKIMDYLAASGWIIIDVESELLALRAKLDAGGIDNVFELGTKIKEWFNAQPSNLVLTNASILYHDMFLKISPVGAFKYNSRNKNCVIFLEDEHRLGKRIYHGQLGAEDYFDQEINDIILVDLKDVEDDFGSRPEMREIITDYDKLSDDAIGRLFNFQQIKDVIDIDADLDAADKRAELVSSYVISESLESQIVAFFDNLEKPNHKACTVIGNYGSGKSHLVGFLVSLVAEPSLAQRVSSEKIRQAVGRLNRHFYSVQFELQAGQVELKQWFFGKIRQQLKAKYQIEVPVFDPGKDFDDKENMKVILEIVKQKDPSIGLLVIIDEVSDFLATKQKEAMKADLQFLRVIGQVCQDQDLMFVGSMQEDVFTSSKFKDVASEIGRIGERFQNIIIHKEDIRQVIAHRIVPKSEAQRHELETRFAPYSAKIDDISRNIDEYVDLFPLTPFLLGLFSDLPYFEKRGVIQFAMTEIKYLLNEPFPCFITFEKIYDLLANNPNKRNLEEIYEITRVMAILTQKIHLLENRFQADAIKIVKGLAVYSLWDRREKGSTAQELANNLLLLPQKAAFSAADNISLIVKKIRDVTEGEYVKISKDESTGLEYFRFVTRAGIDPEQKIAQKAASVSNSEIEYELFDQLADMLELERVHGHTDVFEDECEWKSVKSFRKGYLVFVKEASQFSALPARDYAIAMVSPFENKFNRQFAPNQLNIKLQITVAENIELIKEIVAIKALINSNFQKQVMTRKLEGRINGYALGQTQITGFKYRLVKILMNRSVCEVNGAPTSIKSHIGRERSSAIEILDALKTSVFDEPFNQAYPLHPRYAVQLSAINIVSSLTLFALDLVKGDFTHLNRSTIAFLRSIHLLDHQEYPDISQSKIALTLLDKIKANPKKVTDIQKELVAPLCSSQYGLEPEVVHFVLVTMTVLGRIFLQARGGDKIDINNIREKFKSLAAFETIAYTKIQEDYSYDFAARLLNALGLNGIRITLEKERLNAFKEYKEKVHAILTEIQSLEETIRQLRQKPTLHIDIAAIQKEFDAIQAVGWQGLNIANHTQFGTLEATCNPLLPKITIALKDLQAILSALDEYETEIHDALGYMNQALELLDNHGFMVTDAKKYATLTDFRDEVVLICSDFALFTDRSQRNPIKGKIQQFKKTYIFDFYHAAHEKYVGKKVDWNALTTCQTHPIFQRLKLLNDVTCISDTQFKQLVIRWNELAQHRCTNSDLEDHLKTSVRCPKCLFPGQGVKYSAILAEIAKIESTLGELLKSYEKNIVREVREYRDNVQFLDQPAEKTLIQTILTTQKLPDSISLQDIKTINKLFKEIDIVEIDSGRIINALFPSQEMTTLEDFRKRFFALEHDIKKDRQEGEVRIILK